MYKPGRFYTLQYMLRGFINDKINTYVGLYRSR